MPLNVLYLALLIGIDEYQSPDVPDLQGCVNDVEDMKDLLVNSFGFPEASVKTLTNSEATRDAILQAFREHLLKQARAESRVVIHFSGYSSQMIDVSGDESDGLDETIVPYDSRMPGKFDITDDEIADLLGQLRKITEHCLVVFDSTFSFQDRPNTANERTITRARYLRKDDRVPPPPTEMANTDSGDRVELGALTKTYATIVACDADEMAYEFTIRGKVRGALTYFLAEELRYGTGLRSTYREIARAVQTKVGIVLPGQRPQFTGEALDAEMFDLGQRDVSTTIVATPDMGDEGVVQLWTARSDEFTEGSTFGLNSLAGADPADSPGAIVQIAKPPTGRSATARYVQGPPIKDVGLAVEREHVFSPFLTRVYLEHEFNPQELDELRAALGDAGVWELMDRREDATAMVRIRRGIFEVAGIDRAERPTECASVDSVITSLKERAIWTNLASLNNPFSPLKLTLSVEPTEQHDAALRPIGIQDAQYVDGKTVKVRVTNESKVALYVCIANFSSDLAVQMILPTDGRPTRLEPGESREIEGVQVSFLDGAVEVRNRLRLFAFRQPIDAWLALDHPDAAVPAPRSPLQRLFSRAVLREVGREPLLVPVDQWAAQSYDFDVIRGEGPYLRVPFFDQHKTVSVHSPVTGERVAKIVEFEDNLALRTSALSIKRWIIFDALGRYDASDDVAASRLVWKVDDELIGFDQLKARYYDPGLFDKYVGVSREPLRSVAPFSAPELYPELKVTFLAPDRSQFRIALRPRSSGSDMGRVVVKLNGKQITADAWRDEGFRNLLRQREILASGGENLLVDLSRDPRWDRFEVEKNQIEVYAYNQEGYLRSNAKGYVADDSEVTADHAVIRRGGALGLLESTSEVEAATPAEPKIWGVVVGVSNYQGEGLRLRYADADAEHFREALRGIAAAYHRTTGIEDEPDIRLLCTTSNERPTRSAILGALNHLKDCTKPQDIAIVFLSGHGVNHAGEYYFLTPEAITDNLNDPIYRDTAAISSRLLSDAMNAIPARKTALILDTCAAGAAIATLTGQRGVPSDQIRLLEELKDRTGFYVLAGCAADRQSYEASRYGQGLLTWSLLTEMRRQYEPDNDRNLLIDRLFFEAAERVPLLARQLGQTQRPVRAMPRASEDFLIGIVNNTNQEDIRPQNEKPLIVRTHFQEEENILDSLQLSRQINQRLRDPVAGDGTPLPFLFIDADNFPDAYQLAGRYRQVGETGELEVTRVVLSKQGEPKTMSKDFRGDQATVVAAIVRALQLAFEAESDHSE